MADAKELTQLQRFLGKSDTGVASAPRAGTHLLVVIDHREARITDAEVRGSIAPQTASYDPFSFGRALRYNQAGSDGQRKPELRSYYKALAKTLQRAEQTLLFGTDTGASSAMEELLRELKYRHQTLAEHIIGAVAVDEHHLTDDELLAKA